VIQFTKLKYYGGPKMILVPEFGFISGMIFLLLFIAAINSFLYERQLERHAQNERMTLREGSKPNATRLGLRLFSLLPRWWSIWNILRSLPKKSPKVASRSKYKFDKSAKIRQIYFNKKDNSYPY